MVLFCPIRYLAMRVNDHPHSGWLELQPKRQKHVSALIVAVVIPPRRDLKTTNQKNDEFFILRIGRRPKGTRFPHLR
jgi:hypothetical protein